MAALALAQFINHEFDPTVQGVQVAITNFLLVMAALIHPFTDAGSQEPKRVHRNRSGFTAT
ncbi:hypothetical protein [Streptomyces sp. NBC_00696]|uniref:hypothetical protein n=1 Tax=Streptomyces sp. NBC_00696 TaxID=2903672 RepID=UPI002E332605|nr:hypothetical protein [Streptomyces sp. NBC_00696]